MPLTTLEIDVIKWLLCILIGGLVALDATGWPQAMVSRPIVAATLGGALFGSPAGGWLAGAGLELLFLRYPPYGGRRIPDAGPASFVAGAAMGAAGSPSLFVLLVALVGGWLLGWGGSAAVRGLRHLNARLVGRPDVLRGPRGLVRRHRLAMLLDALRGSLFTAAFLIPFLLLTRLSVGVGGSGSGAGWLLLGGALSLSAGMGARDLTSRGFEWTLVFVGVAIGLGLRAGLGGT